MELAAVSFENYKSFKERVELDLGQITYLIGPNGAGKSNVFAGINFISAMVHDGDRPKLGDCFDGMGSKATTFSFTVKLPKDARLRLLERKRGYSGTPTSNNKEFEFLKHEVSFQNNQQIQQKLLLSDASGTQRLVQELSGQDGVYQLGYCSIESMNLNIDYVLTQDSSQSDSMNIREFITYFDSGISNSIIDLFSSLRLVGDRKEFSSSAPVGEDHEVSSDGSNLPNQLMTMFNDRSQIQKFGNQLKHISSKEVIYIDSKLQGINAVIELQEKWRKSTTDPSEISSGHHQQVILLSFLARFKEPLVMIEEPELHLHASVQKNLLDFIRDHLPGKQVIIATHSPIFVNVSETESTFLLSKDERGSHATLISESNANLIRLRMGIDHSGILGGGHLLCVEGLSEKIAIPALARRLGYEAGPSPWILDLEGYGNTKHLELLLKYLGMEDKKFFILLDKNSKARAHVEQLLKKDKFTEDQCHFLEGNFEDLFPSNMLAECSMQLAKERGVELELSGEELERRRKEGSVTDVLEKEWKTRAPGHGYPKKDLAALLAREPGEVPEKAAEAVGKVMAGLGISRA